MSDLLEALGDEIADPEEEVFSLFSQSLCDNDLGFVDPKRDILELTVAGQDLTIRQSPTILRSDREQGTTGAVVWKASLLFADWITSANNTLFETGILSDKATVLELGCGVSGIVSLALAPRIGRYVATDQDYVLKLLGQNIAENTQQSRQGYKENVSSSKRKKPLPHKPLPNNIRVMALDWELDSVSNLPALLRTDDHTVPSGRGDGLDCVIACDCIYNEALLKPFVGTCAAICGLRSASTDGVPTVCVVAQQLRSPDVFGQWLELFQKRFRVWRLDSEVVPPNMHKNSGFVIHLGILRHGAS